MLPPTTTAIKRKITRAACPMPRAEDRLRVDGSLKP
jgi:hypothetical protein